jgi:hypothetical protein
MIVFCLTINRKKINVFPGRPHRAVSNGAGGRNLGRGDAGNNWGLRLGAAGECGQKGTGPFVIMMRDVLGLAKFPDSLDQPQQFKVGVQDVLQRFGQARVRLQHHPETGLVFSPRVVEVTLGTS